MNTGRYLLFVMEAYYPSGGYDDFAGRYGSVERALGKVRKLKSGDWFHIVDSTTDKIVYNDSVEAVREKTND